MRLLCGFAAAMLLAACGARPVITPQPVLTPLDVAIPVMGGCVPADLAAAPEYPDSDADLRRATDAAARYALLYAGRKLRSARLAELEPIAASCPKANAQ